MALFTIEVTVKHQLEFATPLILSALTSMKEEIMAAIDDLSREVEENTSATQSAITLLGNLKAKLDEAIASQDWSKVSELSATLSNNSDALAAAVAANTPAEGA